MQSDKMVISHLTFVGTAAFDGEFKGWPLMPI